MTPEDEAWHEIERKQKAQHIYLSVIEEAQVSAERFIADNNVHELGIMTLRKAYEIGYRADMHEVERKKNG